jgi:CRISPR-associated endonuclease/helicase Cas3
MMKHQEGNFHLSTFMCPAHRSVVLERITETLAANEPCKVISTQLVEAGVDIDFPVVFRAMAGVDSIAQAAGRCNREGRLEIGTVFLFEPDATIPPGHLRQAADTTEEVMRRYEDILSLDAVHEYFETLFWTKGEKLDEKQILQLLAEEASKGNFPFRKVGERFRLIDDDTRPIIVPWAEEGRNLVEEIRETEFPSFQLTRKAQRFSVSVWHQLFQKLRLNGAIDILHEQYAVLANPDVYRDDVGLCLEDPLFYKAETLMA